MVKGCLAWQESGLKPPPEVLEATEQYKSESDIIGDWLELKTITGKKYEATAKQLYEDYCKFKDVNGDKPVSKNTFCRKLTEKGFMKLNRGGKIYYKGIGLKE